MQNIDEFLDSLLTEKGIVDVDPEVREGIHEDLKIELYKHINRAAVSRLSEEKIAELDKLAEDENFKNEQLWEFVQNAGVDLNAEAQNVMEKFRQLYLGNEE